MADTKKPGRREKESVGTQRMRMLTDAALMALRMELIFAIFFVLLHLFGRG